MSMKTSRPAIRVKQAPLPPVVLQPDEPFDFPACCTLFSRACLDLYLQPSSDLLQQLCKAVAVATSQAAMVRFTTDAPIFDRALQSYPLAPLGQPLGLLLVRLTDTGQPLIPLEVIHWLINECTTHLMICRMAAPMPSSALTTLPFHLTSQEVNVLAAYAHEPSMPKVAVFLGIAYSTVRTHAAHIREKLHVPSLYAAVLQARTLGILPPAAPDDYSNA